MLKPFNPNDILFFDEYVEGLVSKTKFGTITFNVMIFNGVPKIETLTFVKGKRIKYPIKDIPKSAVKEEDC